MIPVELDINNVARLVASDAYGTGAKWRLESGLLEAGPFTEIDTGALIAGTNQYTVWDPDSTTATWYRFRVSTAAPATPGDYSEFSAAFRANALAAYADVDDLFELLPDSPDDTVLNYLRDILVAAAGVIDTRCGRQFYRIPQVSGTVTRLYDGDGSNRLVIPEGIVSVTSLRIAQGTGLSFIAQNEADFFLEPGYPKPGDSRYVIELTDSIMGGSTYTTFPRGKRTIEFVGVLGYDPLPGVMRTGNLALAREMYALSATGRGSASGAAGQGSIAVPDLLPRATYDAITWGSQRMRWLET